MGVNVSSPQKRVLQNVGQSLGIPERARQGYLFLGEEEEHKGEGRELCLLAPEFSLFWRLGNKRVEAEGFALWDRP